MREQEGTGGTRGRDDGRPPPPSIGTPLLLLVFATAATLFSAAALLLHPGSGVLRTVLLVLTVAPVLCGWGLWSRFRRQPRRALNAAYGAVLGSALLPTLGRALLDWSEGRPPNPFDVAFLVLAAGVLLSLLALGWGRRKRA